MKNNASNVDTLAAGVVPLVLGFNEYGTLVPARAGCWVLALRAKQGLAQASLEEMSLAQCENGLCC